MVWVLLAAMIPKIPGIFWFKMERLINLECCYLHNRKLIAILSLLQAHLSLLRDFDR